MPLINCPDCNSQVSDRAPACIKCGCPLAEASPYSSSKVQTIEQTSKSLKLQEVVSVMILIFGIVLFASGISSKSENTVLAGVVNFIFGALWFVAVKAGQWWENG